MQHVRKARRFMPPKPYASGHTSHHQLKQPGFSRQGGPVPTAHADRRSRTADPLRLVRSTCEQNPRARHASCRCNLARGRLSKLPRKPSPASPARTTVAMSGPGDKRRAREFRSRARVRVGRCVRGLGAACGLGSPGAVRCVLPALSSLSERSSGQGSSDSRTSDPLCEARGNG